MQVWYVTAVSALYGMAVFFYMMAVMASPEGRACKNAQTNRYNWMMVEIISVSYTHLTLPTKRIV